MVLLIDNYDSFVHNLARYFERLGQRTVVVRNDAIDAAGALAQKPDAIILSPGPCTPTEAGCSMEIVRKLSDRVPILGICLGHQAIGAAFGARIVRAVHPMHGRTSEVRHNGRGLFAGLPNLLNVGRYHSLVVDETSLPSELLATAHADDGAIMALQHRELPVVGLQFHPESILTEGGYELLAGFLRIAGLPVPGSMPSINQERPIQPAAAESQPVSPVTF